MSDIRGLYEVESDEFLVVVLNSNDVPDRAISHARTHRTGLESQYGIDRNATKRCGVKTHPSHQKTPPDAIDEKSNESLGKIASANKNQTESNRIQ